MRYSASSASGRYYRPELDVVRFLAFLLVFLNHTLPSKNHPDIRIDHLLGAFAPLFYGSLGVTRYGLSLFFVLSAFLICELLLREREIAGTIAIKQFYIRRILRIWPLYYFVLTLGVMVALLPGGNRSEIADIGWFAIFMGAWHSSLFGFIGNPVVPLWSISVEEQFYLIAPWAIKYFSRKSLYGFCAVLVSVASVECYHLGRISATWYRIWGDSLVQFECFAAGILLCLMLRGRMPRILLWQRLILIFIWGVCWEASDYELHYRYIHASVSSGCWPLIGSYALAPLGSVLVLVAFLGVTPKLLPRWAIHLGRISFGLYVYHEFALAILHHFQLDYFRLADVPFYPLRAFMTAGLSLGLPFGLTVLMAALSYRYIETPFLRMKTRHAVIQTQPSGALSDR